VVTFAPKPRESNWNYLYQAVLTQTRHYIYESYVSINQEHRQIFPRSYKIVCQCRRLGCNVRGPGAFSRVELIRDGETKKALDKSLGVEGKSWRW
jgi:hypothetical protein